MNNFIHNPEISNKWKEKQSGKNESKSKKENVNIKRGKKKKRNEEKNQDELNSTAGRLDWTGQPTGHTQDGEVVHIRTHIKQYLYKLCTQ